MKHKNFDVVFYLLNFFLFIIISTKLLVEVYLSWRFLFSHLIYECVYFEIEFLYNNDFAYSKSLSMIIYANCRMVCLDMKASDFVNFLRQ